MVSKTVFQSPHSDKGGEKAEPPIVLRILVEAQERNSKYSLAAQCVEETEFRF